MIEQEGVTNSRPLPPCVRFSYTAVSIVDVHRLIRIGYVIISFAYQSFFCKYHFYSYCIGCPPVTSSAISAIYASSIGTPSSIRYFYLLQGWYDTLYSPAGRQFFEFLFHFLPELSMNTDEYAVSVPSQCKVWKLCELPEILQLKLL